MGNGSRIFSTTFHNFKRILNGFGSERRMFELSRQSPFQSYQDPKKLFPINQYMNILSIDHLIFINIGILITNRSFASSEGPQSAGPILACRQLLSTGVLRGHPIRWIDLCCMAGGTRLWRGRYACRLRRSRIRAGLRTCGGLVFFVCCSILAAV